MLIVIDGYNMLRHYIWSSIVTEQERNEFILRIAQYNIKKGHDIVVVFDGGPYQWPFRHTQRGIVIIYSGMRAIADDCIKDYFSAHKEAEMLLVSSDRELNTWAMDHDIYTISSGHFWKILFAYDNSQKHKSIALSAVKLSDDDNIDLDDAMYNSMPVDNKLEEQEKKRLSHGKMQSKWDRKKQAILKKL